MKNVYFGLITVLICQLGLAQIEHGGFPFALEFENKNIQIPTYTTPEIDLKLVEQEDAVTDQYKETMYRFGIDHEVDVDFFELANTVIHKERIISRLQIYCPDARSVNFLVDDFYLPEGSQLFVYSPNGGEIKGAFTAENNRENRIFPVGLVGGDQIVIEYSAPLNSEDASFHISQITHGYRSVLGYVDASKGPFGSSGPCNINVNCPEGLPWADQKRTAAIIVQGGGVCSGSMVNNVNQDETPLFLTANHCLGNPASWTYYFNHESASCSGSSGPTNQSISGGSLLASSSGSDFALIELNSSIPASYEPCFAGYDATDIQNVTSAVSIHHPGGDVKKICFEEDSPFHQNISFNGNPSTRMWYINQWEDGVTEPGSSGSPLYNQEGRVVGVLSGGAAACAGTNNNGQYDFYGRVGFAWDGTNSSNRLKDHLDPGNTNTLITDMFCPYDVVFPNDAAGQGIFNIPDLSCSLDPFSPEFNLKNSGSNTLNSVTLNYTYNGDSQDPIEWTGSLEQNESTNVTLASFTPQSGSNTIIVSLSMPNGVSDDNSSNDVNSTNVEAGLFSEANWTVTINTDDYGYETYWEVREQGTGDVVAFGGNTEVGPNGGGNQDAGGADPGAYDDNDTYITEVEFTESGCYEFIIVDDYADGICCSFGSGSYSVVDGGGEVIVEGGEFGATETTTRSVVYTSLSEDDFSQRIQVYPNTVSDILNVRIPGLIGTVQLRLLNSLGQMIKQEIRNNTGELIQIDTRGLVPGNYLLELSNDANIGVKRFSVK